jgi:hypothetical protein
MRHRQATLGPVMALAVAVSLFATLFTSAARAGCCQLVRVDPPENPMVRVCENDGAGGCGTVLFEGDLTANASQPVCTEGPTLVYQEWETASASFSAPVVARCEDADVEL